MTLWLDVDDLFFFARHSARPTGIQRLTGEIYKALARKGKGIGFVVHDDGPAGFRAVDWPTVLTLYEGMTGGGQGATAVRPTPAPAPPPASPPVPGRPLSDLLRRFRAGAPAPETQMQPEDHACDQVDARQSGDILCSLGAPWHDDDYAARVQRFIRGRDIRFAMLVHDLIPLLRPQFFEQARAPSFEKFMRSMLPVADVLFTNSRATAADVVYWALCEGIGLRCKPQPLPIGTGFSRPPPGPLPAGLEPGGFVLFVSTIEIRKNHLQAFRVWSRMLEEMPRDRVPTLVFAGTPGWMVADLLKSIESTDKLAGKLVVIPGPDDATLCALYRACRFTLFLSYYEGWGLPVSDSLSFGKICVASNRTSIPEAGGISCVYVDPDNTTGAYRTIRHLIEDPAALSELERRLAHTFTPVPWTVTADAVLQALAPARPLVSVATRSLGLVSRANAPSIAVSEEL